MIELPELVQHILVIAVTIALMGLLLVEKIKPAVVFFGAVLIFLLAGIIDTNDFLDALSNESILSIFLLIFITFGVRTNYNILGWMDKIFGGAKKGRTFVFKMSSMVAIFSSFLNNTPIVALFLPYVYQWAKKRNVSPSKLLIPLSFAAMAGGMITVIGTSTNLILKGLVEAEGGTPPGALDYFFPGIIISGATVLYLVTIGYSLLPNRKQLLDTVLRKQHEYKAEVDLVEDSELIGKTIEESELNKLKEIELFEIIRHDIRISPLWPNQRILKGDRLVFVGKSNKIIELLERNEDFIVPHLEEEGDVGEELNPGLEKVEDTSEEPKKTEKEEDGKNVVETVIPVNSTLIGRTLQGYRFRERFDAAVIGIHRNGEELKSPVDKVRLKPGDLLLLIPGRNFRKERGQENDLYVISVIKNISGVPSWVRKGFFFFLALIILGLAFKGLSLFFALLLLMSYMVMTGMVSIYDLKKQFSVSLFVILVASLAFSTALINSGVAEIAANAFMGAFENLGNTGVVIGIYLVTLVVASFVTHAAAVAIVFPIAFSIGSQISGLDMTAVFIAIAFAASASFHTPFSYQTNMMVYGPGGYKFTDFLKSGLPLTLLYSALVIAFLIFYYQL